MSELVNRVRLDVTSQPLTCNNEDALKCFNKALTEYVLVRENFYPLFQQALVLEGDTLVIAHSTLVIIYLINLKAPSHELVSPHLDVVKRSLVQDCWCARELAYMRGASALASGDANQATEHLCTMLLEHPGDLLALRLCADMFGARGEHFKSRDSCARAMPFWTKDMPLYCGLLANYGFALEESKERDRGAELCRRALDIEKRLPFAIHGLAHVYEETCNSSEGVEFLTRTRSDWSGLFAGHITWHLTLMYLDLGELDNMFREFDSVLKVRAAIEDNVKGLMDASSLLWRLEVMGVTVGEERWEVITKGMKRHLTNHRSPWYCTHIMFSLMRGKVSDYVARLSLAREMIRSIEENSTTDGIPFQNVTKMLGIPVCNALLAYGEGKYDEVLQIMVPLRHEFVRFGGSWAQRQVLNVTMIETAIKDNNLPVAIGLVAEMRGHKPKNERYKKLLQELVKLQTMQK